MARGWRGRCGDPRDQNVISMVLSVICLCARDASLEAAMRGAHGWWRGHRAIDGLASRPPVNMLWSR